MNAPPGRQDSITEPVNAVSHNAHLSLDVDNEFFHVTCHVDPVIQSKIQKGEYVELERLLPKNRNSRSNENKLDLVYHNGHSFFVPASQDNKINGV